VTPTLSPSRGPRSLTRAAVAILTGISLASASLVSLPSPDRAAAFTVNPASVFINEIHYDNSGADTGEFVEIAGPAGTDLTGWSIVPYNGNGGVTYSPTGTFIGPLAPQQNGFGTASVSILGLMNGAPDGIALVNNGTVVQFLSYEGSFLATNGPASGLTSTDIGVLETGSAAEPAGLSLQLQGTGATYQSFSWTGPIDDSPGEVNTGQTFVAPTNQAITATCPADFATGEGVAATAEVTASDPDGTVTSFSIAVDPAAASITIGGVVTEGEGTPASATITVADTTLPGVYTATVTATNSDTPTAQSATCDVVITVEPDNATIVMTCGGPLSTPEGTAATRQATASDADGTVVSIVIDSIAPSDPGTITVGPTTAESGSTPASATVTIGANTPIGTYTVTMEATNDDESELPQSATCSFTVTALDIIPIGQVQGQTLDTELGTRDRSPFAPATGNSAGTQNVVIQGVIYQETLARTSTGANQRGFFIQNRPSTAETVGTPGFDDGDPLTSDGIFVFMGGFETTLGGYNPEVGDEIILQGRVSEFFNLTQISSGVTLLAEVREDVVLDVAVPAFETAPPDNFDTAMRYWERREGMRARVPALSIVQNGRNVFPSTADGEVWVIRGDHPVALRTDPYSQRVFRDPHPLDNNSGMAFDDGNGFRILMGSLGIKAALNDNTALIAPARTFDKLTNSPVGGIYFSFEKYLVQVEQQLVLIPGVDPATNAPPAAPDRATEYSISSYNVENLYDRRDDPFDGCDFTGNAGCPGVSPPFDYVPVNDAFYQNHLNDIAQQIITNLHAPDVLLIQEAEDQDICTVTAGAMVCGATNNRDGRPDTLQELALRITANGGPTYLAAYDRDGADDRGIVSAIMYRTDRVELLAPSATDPVLGSSPTVSYRGTPLAYNTHIQNPKALNADLPSDVNTSTGVDGSNVFTRPPQVALLRIWQTSVGSGQSIDLYAISNHFSSTPDARVGQRREQALYNAAIVAAIQAVTPDQRVIVGGDFNVYPRPDDPFPPPGTSDQLKPLYDAALSNLWERLVAEVPASAYSYVFQGQAQTLDSFFVVFRLLAELVQVRTAHVNSDWPNDYDGDLCLLSGGTQTARCPRGASDHDPTVARFRFPPLPAPPAPPAPPVTPTTPTPPAPQSGTLGSTGTPQLPNTAVTPPEGGRGPGLLIGGLALMGLAGATGWRQRRLGVARQEVAGRER